MSLRFIAFEHFYCTSFHERAFARFSRDDPFSRLKRKRSYIIKHVRRISRCLLLSIALQKLYTIVALTIKVLHS